MPSLYAGAAVKRRDLTGQRFGRLVAIEDAGRMTKGKASARAWRWRCDCGVEFVDWSKEIVGGRKMSCGCRKRETLANVGPMTVEKADRRCKDLTGQRFGRLLVTGRDGTSYHGRLWAAVCDCGQHVQAITTSSLTSGMRVSCGCQQKEAGMRNLEKAREARTYILAAKRSRLLSGILFKPHIRPRAASVVHRVKD